jgi:hypothetical protein
VAQHPVTVKRKHLDLPEGERYISLYRVDLAAMENSAPVSPAVPFMSLIILMNQDELLDMVAYSEERACALPTAGPREW